MSRKQKSERKEIPEVLSIQRGTIVTDGIMSSIIQGANGEYLEPVRVIRHGIRGITAKEKAKDVYNIQITESAKTSHKAIGLHVGFSYRAIDAQKLLFSCSDKDYANAFTGMINRVFFNAEHSEELTEVCRRYARNILNGRWLWRNRVLGKVTVEARHGDRVFSGEGSSLIGFDCYTDAEKALADIIINQLRGNDDTAIEVSGRVMFGFTGEVEVFPSQNMVNNKPSGFARSLYKVDPISRRDLLSIISKRGDAGDFAGDIIDMGIAALRDQKIGNAIRTIDTWYPGYEEVGCPIPVEPNGASIEHNWFYRESHWKNILSKTTIENVSPGSQFNPEIAYLIALVIRGGVYGKQDEQTSESQQ